MNLPLHQRIEAGIDIEYSSVGELFRAKAEKRPTKQFLISPSVRSDAFSYRDFQEGFLGVAGYLQDEGLKKGDRISLVIPNSPEFLLMYFGALASGITVVPINYDLAPREIAFVVENSGSRFVFYDSDFGRKMAEVRSEIGSGVRFSGLRKLPHFAPAWSAQRTGAASVGLLDEAVIIYTSGTTGDPKGVILTHLNLLADAKAISEWFRFSTETRTLCILPLFHNNGQVVTLLAPLYAGGSTVIVKGKASLRAFWGLVAQYRVTWTSVMTSILSILLSLPVERKDRSLRGIVCGGQILSRSVQEAFEERFEVPVFEGYGLTETTSFSCFNGYPAERRKTGSIGLALPVNEMAIMDDQGRELGPGQEGEICIRGLNVTGGYLGLSEKNRSAFAGGWFHSGDYGYRDEEGHYYFQGREDALIIKGGENIYPAELENVLYQHPAVAECAAIGIPDKLLGEDICAFVKLREGAAATEDELKEFCRGKIARFKQAKEIVFLPEIPRGPTKKTLYRKLRQQYQERQ